jgi:2-dehydro-3-deoxyphosphogalactonate aldolase
MLSPEKYFSQNPLVAILRGVKPDEVVPCGEAIVAAGWRVIEVPLNSPDALKSIELLSTRFGEEILIGAGTVLSAQAVADVATAGGRLIVAPNTNAEVVDAALARGLVILPGVYTATEAFQAYKLGARYLKLFPADSLGPAYVKALKAVLPKDAHMVPTGGVSVETIADFHAAGSRAYGIGSQVYKPGMSAGDVGKCAQTLSDAAAKLSA